MTYNAYGGLSDAQALADIEKLAETNVHVIALQEMGARSRRDLVRSTLVECEGCAWDAYLPLTGPEASIPMLFRRDAFVVELSGSLKVSEATYVGSDGAGPSTLKAKFVNYVVMEHVASGQRVAVLNNHAVASVQAKDGGPNYDMEERLQLYRQHMAGLKQLISQFAADGVLVFVTGDFNVNFRKDRVVRTDMFPYMEMGKVGTRASYVHLGEPDIGTHGDGTRLIDYVMNRTDPAVTATSHAVWTGYASDHRPVVARYAVKPVEPPGPSTVPQAPTNVTATRGDKQVTLTWETTGEEQEWITGFQIAGAPDDVSMTVDGTVRTAVVTGLTNGRRYTFTVAAMNKLGTGPTSAATPVVIPATVPRQMAAPEVVVRDRKAIVKWTPPVRTGGSPILGYKVLINDRVRATTGPDVQRFAIRDMRRARYTAKMVAFNAVGASAPSLPRYFRIR